MLGKALFLAAGAAGYVLGARAGRERYDQIAGAAGRLWGNPKVQSTVGDLEDRATGLAKQAGSAAQEKVGAAASSVASSVKDKVGGGSSSTAATASAAGTPDAAGTSDTGLGAGSGLTSDPTSASGVGAPLGEQHHTRMPTD
ncbi:YtxH domain-containing protein [Kineococcus sp. T13]|uniref:YtxH domain-containing protein n=1 Tax=Kineococcus vitellinus TaxID=2696565 RepID=UPI00141376F2|nr:YtxH domain-containing protein [Kineococcus vitellinus]NAZ77707.1 YtxH domain-containing protein [Kineococcus vitellinus]